MKAKRSYDRSKATTRKRLQRARKQAEQEALQEEARKSSEGDPPLDRQAKEATLPRHPLIVAIPSLRLELDTSLDAEPVGEGAFGAAYAATTKALKGIARASKTSVALKWLKGESKKKRENALRERDIICRLTLDSGKPSNDGIVRLYRHGLWEEGQDCCLVLELFDHSGFFSKYCHDLDAQEVRSYMGGLLDALAFMHERKICHQDVKPSNYLYSRGKQKGKLIDFGLADTIGNERSSSVGTCGLRPPEVLIRSCPRARRHSQTQKTKATLTVHPAADIWAAGVMLLSLLSGRYPFFKIDSRLGRHQRSLQNLAAIAALVGNERMIEAIKSVNMRSQGRRATK